MQARRCGSPTACNGSRCRPGKLVDYYDTHVAADAVHEQVAVRTICGSLVEAEPGLRAADVLGGGHVRRPEERVGAWVLDRRGVE